MAVFENEKQTLQGAEYYAHLNRNWDNGNRAFQEINNKLDALSKSDTGSNSFDDNFTKQLNDLETRLKKQISRVTLGTDTTTIEEIVTKILIERGVI